MKRIIIIALLGALSAQAQTQEPAGCFDAYQVPCKVIYPGAKTLQILIDGSVWGTLHVGAENQISVQLPPNGPATGVFNTFLIVNRDTDVVAGAALSDKIQIQGDCQSQTFEVMGGVSFSGKNASGVPIDILDFGGLMDIGQAGVVRRVTPGSSVEIAFAMVCGQKLM